MSAFLRSAIAGTCLMAACNVAAADVSWSVGAGLAHTDNAARVPTLEVSDTIASIGGSIEVDHEGPRVEASLFGQGNYLRYLDDTFDDDLVGTARGKLVLGVVPDRVLWTFEDTFGQVTATPFLAATPDNRDNVNVFSTGPDFILRLGGATELRLNGRLRQSTYEGSQVDDQGLSGEIALVRRSSAQVSWSLVGSAARVEYDLPDDPGYDLQSLFGRIEANGARQSFSIDVGATRLNDALRSDTKPLVRVSWNRNLTPSWSLNVAGGTEYRGTSDRFVAGVSVPGAVGTVDVQFSNVPAKIDHFRAGFQFSRPRTTFGFGGSMSREEYEGASLLDRDETGVYARATRRFTEKLTGLVEANYFERDFKGTGVKDDTTRFGASVDWQLGRSTFVTLGARSEQRSGDLAALEYDETIAYVNVTYRVGPAQAPQAFIF